MARENIPVVCADPKVGLTRQQAAQRREAGLISGKPKPTGKSRREIVVSHVFTFFNLIFLLLAVMLVLGGSTVTNMGFLMVAMLNTAIGIIQELRAKAAVDRLTLVAERPVTVIREGKRQQVSPEQLLRDDIAEFSQGDQPAADGILRQGELWVDESLITGESDAVTKVVGDTLRSGSVVLAGRGRVQLTAVGEDAFAAKLAREAKKHPKTKKSEMMLALNKLIFLVGILLIPVGAVLFHQEYAVLQLGLRSSVEGTVAALVGMIPEGLYLLTSIALAASALRLSRNRVLVQDMNCIEALARVDVLCVDKTGTITEPDMEVEHLIPLTSCQPEYLETILNAMYGAVEPDNATARAIHELFHGQTPWIAKKRIPFSPETKWSGAVFETAGAFLVGAPEFILGRRFGELEETLSEWTARGSRVLLVAGYKGDPKPGKLNCDKVTPLALLVLSSRIRENAKETFAYFREQGVSLRVLSGDDPRTAAEVALRAGIPGAERYLDAATLVTAEDYARAARETIVFGRVTPEQKKRIIAALQNQGHTVAMTGDGVNDLLAMKQSDCSVALGSGAQAAGQLASLVLLDSDFAAMPGIVAEGRRVINNIQRSATLFLVKNIFSLLLALISLMLHQPYPLQPIHLTMIGALTIGTPSFFLAMEPNFARVGRHFLRRVLGKALPGGVTNVAAVLICQRILRPLGMPQGQIATVCAGILATVGLTVLWRVCKPFDRFRKGLWWAMFLGMLGCFTLLPGVFALHYGSAETLPGMLLLPAMAPGLYFALEWLFRQGENLLRPRGKE